MLIRVVSPMLIRVPVGICSATKTHEKYIKPGNSRDLM